MLNAELGIFTSHLKIEMKYVIGFSNRKRKIGRLLRPDIVQFHFACLGTEIFLQGLILSSTLSSNPKSSRSVDLQFFHKLLSYLHKLYDKFFIVQRHG